MRRRHGQPIGPFGITMVKTHDMEDERSRFIPRVFGPVTEKYSRVIETLGAPRYQAGHRIRLSCCHSPATAGNHTGV